MTTSEKLVALYARQSKEDPNGIKRQVPRMLAIAEARGWTVVDTYTDDDVSASKERGPSTGWGRMLADADRGRINTVLAVDLDRLLRTTKDLNTLIDHGLMAVTVNGEIDLSTADGEFRATMLAGIARFEVRRKGERQSRAQKQRADQGRAPKGTRPMGYTISGDVIEEEAKVVREIYRLFAIKDGPSLGAIASALSGKEGAHIPKSLPRMVKHTRTLAIERNKRRAAEGLELKPIPEDGPWSPSTVLGILRNPRHAGYSVYTNRTQRAAGDKRKQWFAQIVRDEHGEPVKGQWQPLVDEVTWYAVQERLNDQSRVTNRTGSTKRKHLGSSLYKCGVCNKVITAHSRGYRCEGHVTRSRPHVDDFVLRVIKERLSRPDLRDLIPARDEPRMAAVKMQIAEHEGKIVRAQSDYDNEIIEGFDLKRIRDRERAFIADLEAERRSLAIDAELEDLLGSRSPVQAFEDAPLSIQRKIVDFFMEVHLLHHPQGRKGFDPTTVRITPRHPATS